MRRQLYLFMACIAFLLLAACGGMAAYERPPMAEAAAPMPMAEPSPAAAAAPDREEVVLAGASESSSYRTASLSAGAAPPPAPPPPPPAKTPPPSGSESSKAKPTGNTTPLDASGKPSGGEVAVARGPMLIYTADVTIAVFEVNASLGKIEALAREFGGFLARRDDTSITIRVPASRFEEAVKRVEEVGDMLHRNVVAQDVTEEFHDLEVRLRGAHAVQDRLTQLLAKAVKVEESVLIERELDRITGEIDRLEGRMKFLRDRAAYSTITVQFQPKATETIGKNTFRLPGQWLYELGLGRLLSL